MVLTARELWTAIHGVILGALFLLAFSGGMAELYSLRPDWVTAKGMKSHLRRLNVGTSVMAMAAWLTVITGTYIVYPWYRAAPPEGVENLGDYPRSFLLSMPHLSGWHSFGMEWKEHVAWFAPILATAVAFAVWRSGNRVARNPQLRNALLILFILAFAAAGIAGLFGAFITKAAPIL